MSSERSASRDVHPKHRQLFFTASLRDSSHSRWHTPRPSKRPASRLLLAPSIVVVLLGLAGQCGASLGEFPMAMPCDGDTCLKMRCSDDDSAVNERHSLGFDGLAVYDRFTR